MATRGQTHNKRAREMALREKRERKQAKKDDRAAGILPYYDENGVLVYPVAQVDPDAEGEAGGESTVETEGEAPAETEPAAEAVAEAVQ
jgi:preprotein translocase subunit Sec61beta